MRYMVVLGCLLITIQVQGQALGQDREGFSTIVVPTATLNLDVENKIANLAFYKEIWNKNRYTAPSLKTENDVYTIVKEIKDWEKLTDEQKLKKYGEELKTSWEENSKSFAKAKAHNHIILGIELKGSASDGISTLFSSNRVSSSASIGGLFGLRKIRRKYREETVSELAKAYLKTVESNELQKNIDKELAKLVKEGALNENQKKRFVNFREEKSAIGIINAIEAYRERLTPAFLGDNKKKNKGIAEKKIEQINNLGVLAEQIATMVENYNNSGNAFPDLDRNIQLKTINTKYSEFIESFEKHKEAKIILGSEVLVANTYSQQQWLDVLSELDRKKVSVQKELSNIESSTSSYSDLLKLYGELDKENRDGERVLNNLDDIRNESYFEKETLIYARAAFLGSEFLFDSVNSAPTIDERFKKINFQGYRAELGYTRRFLDNHFFGFSSAVSYTSNQLELKKATFTLQNVDNTINPGTLSSSQTIESLQGDFDRFLRFEINTDYIHFIPLVANPNANSEDKVNAFFLGINPYLRHRFYKDAKNIKPHTVAGLGVHSFSTKDNKLMGGLFVQTEDLFGTNADSDSTFLQRINFGLIVKFAIEGFKPKS